MIVLAHIGPVPVEEFLSLAPIAVGLGIMFVRSLGASSAHHRPERSNRPPC